MDLGALILTYVLVAGAAGTAAQGADSPRPSLSDVAFMAGHWVHESAEGLSEEVWTAPTGDGMLGMWRWVSGGKARVFELLSIREEEGGVVLRFRHFDGALTAREEKDQPLVLPLVRRGPGEAAFAGKSASGGPLRLTYRRDGADAMVATLEKDGEKPVTFPLRRAPAAR